MKGLWLALALVACGGDAGSGAPARPPPREVLLLAVRVTQSGPDDAFCPALEVGLARSGIAVVNDASQPADALVTCRVFMGEDDGFLRITSNGQARMKITVRVEVRDYDVDEDDRNTVTDDKGDRYALGDWSNVIPTAEAAE